MKHTELLLIAAAVFAAAAAQAQPRPFVSGDQAGATVTSFLSLLIIPFAILRVIGIVLKKSISENAINLLLARFFAICKCVSVTLIAALFLLEFSLPHTI